MFASFDHAIDQIKTRIDEYEEFKRLNFEDNWSDEKQDRFDQLDERTSEMMAEIAKIAFYTQLDFDLEEDDDRRCHPGHVLSLIHYLTDDPTDICRTLREDTTDESGT